MAAEHFDGVSAFLGVEGEKRTGFEVFMVEELHSGLDNHSRGHHEVGLAVVEGGVLASGDALHGFGAFEPHDAIGFGEEPG